MSNGVLRGLSGLTKLHTLQIPDAYRVTDAGLQFISTLTGRLLPPFNHTACLPGTLTSWHRRKALRLWRNASDGLLSPCKRLCRQRLPGAVLTSHSSRSGWLLLSCTSSSLHLGMSGS